MRMTLLIVGSRGDVQPQAALARGLCGAGHQVRVATHANYEELVTGAGLDLHPIAGDAEKFFSGIAGIAMRERLGDPRRFLDLCESFLEPFFKRFLTDAWESCRDAEAILYWPPLRVGPSLAEKLGIPCFSVSTYPMPHCRTRKFPNPFHTREGPRWGRGLYNWATWLRGEALFGRLFQAQVDQWRRETLSLPPLPARRERRALRRLPYLLGFSPSVLPPPADWPSWLHVTGYWFLDQAAAWEPPRELTDFLGSGPPPVCIGFGSMATAKQSQLTRTALEALRLAGRRGILLSGWGLRERKAQPPLPDNVLMLDSAPHDWLFPRMAAVVHHGGSGTTAAALRAGVPSVIVPFGYDQPLWGRQVAALGAGPPPIPQSELTAERLAAAIRQAADAPDMIRRAAALGGTIRAEDGVGRAVEIVNRYLDRVA